MATVIEKDGMFFKEGDDGKFRQIPEKDFIPTPPPVEDEPTTLTGKILADKEADVVSKGIASIPSVVMDVTLTPFLKGFEALGNALFGGPEEKKQE